MSDDGGVAAVRKSSAESTDSKRAYSSRSLEHRSAVAGTAPNRRTVAAAGTTITHPKDQQTVSNQNPQIK